MYRVIITLYYTSIIYKAIKVDAILHIAYK